MVETQTERLQKVARQQVIETGSVDPQRLQQARAQIQQQQQTISTTQEQKQIISNKINSLEKDIIRISTELQEARERGDAKRGGSRATKIATNRIKGRTESIKFLNQKLKEIEQGEDVNITEVKTKAERIRIDTTAKAERKRVKTEGLTAGTAKQKTTIKFESPVQIQAELSGIGTSKETEIIKTTKDGITTTSTLTRDFGELEPFPTRKTLQATREPTIQTQIQQNVIDNLDFKQTQEGFIAEGRTATPEQIAAIQEQPTFDIGAGDFGKKLVIGGPIGADPGTINLNPGRIVTAPLIFTSETIATGGQNILEGLTGAKRQIKQEGFLKFGGGVLLGTAESLTTDPFGFAGEAAVGGVVVKPIKQVIKKRTTTIEGIDLESTAKTLETSPQAQGLGVQQVEIKGTVDVTEGIFRKTPRKVDIEATGILDKETRIFGKPEPKIDVGIVKEGQISTEFGPTDFLEGKIDVKVDSKVKTAKVEAVRQGDLQITTVDGKTTLSRTEPVINFKDDQIFRTVAKDVKTDDFIVSLSKAEQVKPTTLPTQDLFATASKAQTDTFIKAKEFKPISGKIVDVETVDTIKPLKVSEKPSTLGESVFVVQPESKVIDITKVEGVTFGVEPKITPKKTTTPQQQIFEEVQFKESIPSSITKIDSKTVLDTKFDSKIDTQRPFEVQLPQSFIKDVITEQRGLSFVAPISLGTGVTSLRTQAPRLDEDIFQRKQPTTGQEFGEVAIDAVSEKFSFDAVSIFDTETKLDSEQIQQQTTTPTTTPPTAPIMAPIFPTTPPKFKFDTKIFDSSKVSKKKKNGDSIGEGKFVSSLGGLLTRLTTKEPPKTLTGLELRGIKINK